MPAPRAAFAWWGATACWFLGTLLGGRRTPVEAAVPPPVAVLAYVVCAGLWALLVYGVYRGVKGTRTALAIVGALGIVDLVVQLVGDVVTRAYGHGAFFLAALVLSGAGFVLLFKPS
ncbi:hypothetical protein [Amycolatopsis solani]|uniref:hypothetical protein n=1 Tax=Amycolatopsis solani TaxID=3028615 RepID=UPI0025B129D6|nr:hypothetical protein [Amycolatopsis sp. MEP2-6]